jgi:DNA-binding response OmpR family regulator
MKILVIEDEPSMLETIVRSLEEERYRVESASDYEAALEKITVYEYDCILLDISLPGGSGLELLRVLKERKKTDGIIIVSAKGSIEDKVTGLSLGADDYLPKPFHLAELHARVKSVLRRRKFEGGNHIVVSNVRIDPEAHTVFINDEAVTFNRKEYDILLYFIANKNRMITRTALAEHVWGDRIDEADSFDFIYSQIKNLRRKLKEHGAKIEIHAVYGIGYKLETE